MFYDPSAFSFIKVRDSVGFSLHQRKFVPLDKAKYSGLVTPRLFCDYDSTTEPSRKVELFTKGHPLYGSRVHLMSVPLVG